jgi:hypothetical protein
LTQNSELGASETSSGAPASEFAEGRRSRQPDYTVMQRDLDIAKARRLIGARESAIKGVKSIVEKRTMGSTKG